MHAWPLSTACTATPSTAQPAAKSRLPVGRADPPRSAGRGSARHCGARHLGRRANRPPPPRFRSRAELLAINAETRETATAVVWAGCDGATAVENVPSLCKAAPRAAVGCGRARQRGARAVHGGALEPPLLPGWGECGRLVTGPLLAGRGRFLTASLNEKLGTASRLVVLQHGRDGCALLEGGIKGLRLGRQEHLDTGPKPLRAWHMAWGHAS
eukprot:363235-Chlamydomonas_euryale.AAC.5